MNRFCSFGLSAFVALFTFGASAKAQLTCTGTCSGGPNNGLPCANVSGTNDNCPAGLCILVACSFHGISNEAMGAATLAFDGMGENGRARLAISNIGSSGNDGVRNVVPRPTTSMTVGLACPNMAGAAIGTEVRIDMCGDNGPGGSTAIVSFLRLLGTGANEVTATISMAGVGTTMYTLKGLNADGGVVKMLTGWPSVPDFKSPRVDWEEASCGIAPDGTPTVHYIMTNPVPIVFPDGPVPVANVKEIWVMAENIGPNAPTTQTEFNNFFTNTGPVQITLERISPIPAVSTWGVAMLTMLVVVAGTVVLRRSARTAA